MPIMDGIEATKEIRRLEKLNASAGYPPLLDGNQTPLVRTPSDFSEARSSPYRSSVIIVALTASSLQSDRVAALAAGCNDFLTKPVSLLWLNNKIIEWGSIKALQMWADPGPEMAKVQAAKARNIAERLHVPKERHSPSPSRPPTLDNTAPPVPAVPSIIEPAPSPASAVPPASAALASSSSSVFWSPGQPSPPTFWGHLGIPSPTSNGNGQPADKEPSLNVNLPVTPPPPIDISMGKYSQL